MALNQAYHRDEKIALFSTSYLPSMRDVSPSEDAFELLEIRQECLFPKTQNDFETALWFTKMVDSSLKRARSSHHDGMLGLVPSLLVENLRSIM